MSWTYSGDPSSSSLDELRFKIGDTDIKDPELQDEELNYVISNVTSGGGYSALKASMVALRAILAKYKTLIDEKVGDVDVKWSQRYKRVKELLKEYTVQHALTSLGAGGAYAGGISILDKSTREDSTDRVNPAFSKNFGSNKRKTLDGSPRANTSQISD